MNCISFLIASLIISVNHIHSIRIGIISNVSLTMSSSDLQTNQSNCNQCLCSMLIPSTNLSILSFNCLINDITHVSCQFFTNFTYLNNNTFFQMKTNVNSTFYFQQLPVANIPSTISQLTNTTDTMSIFDDKTCSSTSSTSTTSSSNLLPSQCSNYTIITDGTRHVTYRGGGSCDQSLFTMTPQWIRFCGSAGTLLSNYSINADYCDANAPSWYNGTYPSTIGQTINGTICYYWNYIDTCYWTNFISITNCNSFYVFALIQPPACSLRYCTM